MENSKGCEKNPFVHEYLSWIVDIRQNFSQLKEGLYFLRKKRMGVQYDRDAS